MSFVNNSQLILSSFFNEDELTYAFDELDSSIHSGLFRIIFELMRKSKSQYIFTTHSLDVLRLNLRKDQIMQLERDNNSNIIMTSASEVSIHQDDNYENILRKKFISNPDSTNFIGIIDSIFGDDKK